ncbi:hypothetical protein OAX38_02610 [Flavobacteriaceae bacterium]|nr:hypothetical protein [Flavobacteriaceae bacterium]
MKKPLLFLTLLVLLFSCIKEEFEPIETEQVEIEQIDLSGMTKLGQRLENPYSVRNMKKAWESLQKTPQLSKSVDIETTHLYVKFSPKSEEELGILKQDSTLVLYDIPLDFEVVENGDFYHDPEVPTDRPTYQYTAIPVDKQLPSGVEYEILEELFIPDQDGEYDAGVDYEKPSKSFTSKQTIEQLVDESLRLTGNLMNNEIGNSLTAKSELMLARSKWRPAGTIRVYDHAINSFVGVSGVEVRARRWFTTYKGTTDNNGNYTCDGRFRRDANYSITWELYDYSIRKGVFIQAKYDGPKRRGDWNLDLGSSSSITVDDKQQYYALIHQAAYDYYHGDRFGLTSPPRNAFWKRQITIVAKPAGGTSSYSKARGIIGVAPEIFVRKWNNKSFRVYGTTIHELAHAAHQEVDNGAYNNLVWDAYIGVCSTPPIGNCNINLGPTANNTRRLLETWPTTVEILFTTHRYRNRFGLTNYEYDEENFQTIKIDEKNHYTSAGWDMLDDINQRIINKLDSTSYPIDRVSGYNIVQLEQALIDAYSWEDWRDNIKDDFSNPTEVYLDELFANWTD